MAGKARAIMLTRAERDRLESWLRGQAVEQRLAERARIVLGGSAGMTTKEIARNLHVRPATVSKWRTRFAERRIAGLNDAPRPGAPCKYGADTELRVLSQIENPPPDGHAIWTGKLVADTLGDVSDDHVWRVLHRHGIAGAGTCVLMPSRAPKLLML
ncbi:MAG: helix-turn-helix domain-containing protein [Chloroflexi bacterium]|nr:helix-turn-helix domain-containing protein [Chloroflexota bacterium]